MEKKAILIRSGASFMVNAVQKNLESAGYEVLPVNASVAAVNEKCAEALFRLRQPRQKVDLPVQKHLVKIGKTAVDILVLPARVFGDLAVVFIGVTPSYSALFSALLKFSVLEITDADRCRRFFSGRRLHRPREE